MTGSRFLVLALTGALVAVDRPAAAEDDLQEPRPAQPRVEEAASDAGRESSPPARARGIEEIIVTAQRKEQSLKDVPISVSAFGGEFFKQAGIDNLHELAEFAPGVFVPTNPCCMVVFVRGFGTPFAVSSFDPTVALVLDELLLPRDVYMTEPLYDLDRFEVLRGPQGALFGKNSPAGLFNVVTAKPSKELTGFLIGRIGTLGAHHVEAAIGGPLGTLGDVAQFRVAGLESQQAGDVENTKLGADDPAAVARGGRLSLALQPLDDLEVLFIGSLAHSESRFHGQAYKLSESSAEFLRQFDPKFEDDGFDHQTSIDGREPLSRDTHILQTTVRYALQRWLPLKDAELALVLGLSGFDFDRALDVDVSPADIVKLPSPVDFLHDQRSAELRFSGFVPAPFGFGEIEVLTGYLFFDSDLLSRIPFVAGKDFDEYLLSEPAFELITGSPPPGGVGFEDLNAAAAALGLDPIEDVRLLENDGSLFFLDQQTRWHSPFGNLAWHPSERWTIGFGARLTVEEKQAHLVNECFSPGAFCSVLGIQEFDLDRARRETDFSPRVTLQYFPFEELALYATRAQGFKSGAFNLLSFTTNNLEVGPEKTVSWEVGARGALFERTLSVGAALFNMDVEDLQLQNITGGQVLVRNAASARSRGLELDFQWLSPWEALSLRGAGALTDARFRRFPNALAPASSTATEQDLSGRRMPFVPKTQFVVTPEVRLPFAGPALPLVESLLPPKLVLTTALDVLYRSSQFLDYDLDPTAHQDSYVLLDGRIALSSAEKSWSFGILVENIADTDVLEATVDSVVFPGGFIALQEFQRRVAIELRYDW